MARRFDSKAYRDYLVSVKRLTFKIDKSDFTELRRLMRAIEEAGVSHLEVFTEINHSRPCIMFHAPSGKGDMIQAFWKKGDIPVKEPKEWPNEKEESKE